MSQPTVAVPESRPWLKHYDSEVPHHIDYPRQPLYCLLDESAARCPDQPCTNFLGKRLSYQQVKELSDDLPPAHATWASKGDRVVLLLPNSPQFLIAYYGLLSRGCGRPAHPLAPSAS
jgi:long-chain acyl-CoA synthetase